MPTNNIAKKVKFLGVDGIMAAPILLLLLFPSLGMLYFLIGMIVILYILEKRGMSVLMLFRAIRSKIVGNHRFIRPPWRKFR
ncbi:IcmT/TraK family protein [Psychromonas sp. SP041]|uniref:IcmT/TraK family protein n=1 Tax=Psychromonas sp. SP041 TaxID=1365007 RepID=UPI0010C7A388|nr:IcmT/TraK family protein [Psychromonas sp. SP041]